MAFDSLPQTEKHAVQPAHDANANSELVAIHTTPGAQSKAQDTAHGLPDLVVANNDAPAATGNAPDSVYDVAKNEANMTAFVELTKQLQDKPGPITGDQRKIFETGLQSYDARNTATGNAMDATQALLDKEVPRDKLPAFSKAMVGFTVELEKVADANKSTQADGQTDGKADGKQDVEVPAALQNKILDALGAENPAAFQTAVTDLAKANPA